MRIYKLICFALLGLLMTIKSTGQTADPAFYLIEDLVLEEVAEAELEFLKKQLNAYHRAKVDTVRVRILHQTVEGCGDEKVWPRYNEHLIGEINRSLKRTQTEDEAVVLQKFLSGALNNHGYHYKALGDVKAALRYYEQSLKMDEANNNTVGIALSLNNLASLYSEQGMFQDAMGYFRQSAALSREIGNQPSEATAVGNIGSMHFNMQNADSAMYYFEWGYRLNEESGDHSSMANSLNNIGYVHRSLGDFIQSARYHNLALNEYKKVEDKEGLTGVYINLGVLWFFMDEMGKAEAYADTSLAMANELGYPFLIANAEELMYRVHARKGNWEIAFSSMQRFVTMRDSLRKVSNERDVERQQLKYQYDKRQALAEAEYENKLLLSREAEERQGVYNLFIAGIAILVAGFAVFAFAQLRKSKRQNQVIEEKNEELNASKRKVEEQNREMVDSIEYAKRIQQALLQSEEHVTGHLPEHFILFIPKDILSGDFYWAVENGPYWYVAAADCTGHGVPGALLTMLGNSFLNEIIRGQEPLSPAETLNQLRNKVVKELSQTGEDGGNRDGMDISLVRINLETLEVEWAGAFNPLWIVRNGSEELEEIKANRQPIGHYHRMDDFTNHQLQLAKGDSLYMMSDGFADQLGGKSGKKFRYKPLKELLVAGAKRPLKEQQQILEDTFRTWKGDNMQIDDVCILGIRV